MITQGSPMKSMPTMTMGRSTSSMPSALLRYARLERFEFGIDLVRRTELGDLFLERLRRFAEARRIGASLGEIDPALQHIEAREGVGDLVAIVHLAQLGAIGRAFHAGDE